MHKSLDNFIEMHNWEKFFEDNRALYELQSSNADDQFSLNHTSTVWAKKKGAICLATNLTYFNEAINNPNVDCILTAAEIPIRDEKFGKTVLISNDCAELFYRAHMHYAEHFYIFEAINTKIPKSCKVHTTAVLDGQIELGENVVVDENVVIKGRVKIGDNCKISPNVVIGEPGLFAKKVNGKLQNMHHCGGVVIGSDCHIHAGAVVVKSAFFDLNTTLGANVHVGVMSNIGHDVMIADETVISSNCVIAGRANIGSRCWIGASSTISNSLKIGHDCDVKIGSVVINDLEAGSSVSGNFASHHLKHLKNFIRESR